MKNYYFLLFTIFVVIQTFSQGKYLTKIGYVSFFSHSLVEDIKAENNQVLSIIDSKTGEIEIQLLMKSFLFKKKLMQEHFNNNYVESHKYPRAKFSGILENFNQLNEGINESEIKGVLYVHGKEKNINIKVIIDIQPNEITLSCDFVVEVSDFDIKIPAVVANNISKIIKISIEFHHIPYTK